MRVNENTALVGKTVVLVPYRQEHVQTYHEWMKDPDLLNLTASMPLTLEQEYDMQRSWHLDEDKLTFIVLARSSLQIGSDALTAEDTLRMKMIGDVNMFFKDEREVECEIMIAEREYRRKGCALEALRLLLRYVTSDMKGSEMSRQSSPHLPIDPKSLLARVGASNEPSIALFRKLGFSTSKYVEVFDEVEMRFAWDPDTSQPKDVDKWMSSWAEEGNEDARELRKLLI
ncbi:acyl-CoA N-acyltransferase [Cantharellus anzutake]|uniref:acyl-CoA N-acyltransferase n=1 Tax=Cantharellus anzutake TaxID=1750568 RepID=UPI001903722F|nr:acyl-CoA N-acyltransferase [Cantharellus anzutake]KAF8343184.1 acyl-CoA N-acyltransferase [Cantharellus anzutake]